MQKGMEQGVGSVAGEWAAPCAGKGCAAAWSPPCVPQAGKRAPSPPEAGTYPLCLPSLWSLPFSHAGGVLMRLCMPRVPSNWHWRGKTQQLMEEMMRLGGGILVLSAWLQCELSDCQLVWWFFPLLVSPKCSCCYQSENESKVTAWEMSFQNYPFGRTKQTMPSVLALNVWHLIRVGAGQCHSGLQMYWVPASSSSSWSICRFVRNEDITIDLSTEHWWNCCWYICSGGASETLFSEWNQWGWSSEKGKLNIIQDLDRRIARADVK